MSAGSRARSQLPAGLHAAARLARIALALLTGTVQCLPELVRYAGHHDGVRLQAQAGRIAGARLWDLGPAFVKIGQLLSTRQDLLPPRLCDELRTGLAFGGQGHRSGGAGGSLPPTGARAVEIGSVATVHRDHVDGTPVAVKRVHPGAERQLATDLALVRGLMRAGLRLVPRSRVPLPEIVDEMCRSVRRQTDLCAEAETLNRLSGLGDRLPVVLPRVLEGHSDSGQLVMTWIEGQDPHRPVSTPDRTARRLVLALYEMLFITGVVHCDLHPGNWWEMPDGRIAIVDAGFAYELDDEMRSHFAEFFLGMSAANAEICATHALAACAVPVGPEQEAGFRADMEELIRSNTGLTAGTFSLARFATDFFMIQRRHRAYSRATFIYPFMALLAIEGQVKQLSPGLNFQALAGPVVLRAIVNRARSGSSDVYRKPQGIA
ncbi:AarF/UbiB family protein [Kineosporia sp. NBRC 101731]|uniref:AarF/UbiB family protein n=1 Tax=Kineosporia sp. NBRC 101731 TaxID=3032199 RepID=UPI0024A26D10|nr:AarF/UbiB family protein [Kineosporia sp. NBRC 101731]GLY30377.1 hypothetical protein Kisp02_37420 [Kineosporia sp. NBRC 101731]